MSKILIIDDEEKLRNELKTLLESNGFETFIIEKFDDVINDINNMKCDLLLLDINLPNINGEYLCKEIRKTSQVPIIMVTSRNNEIDELLSINYGADDFITKPYNSQILLARINRLLNRNNAVEELLVYEDIKINISKSIIYNTNLTIDLSRNELKILVYLLNNRGKIISRDKIMDYLWDNNEYVDDNTLTVNINRIRAKLKEFDLEELIVTKRGQGYIIL